MMVFTIYLWSSHKKKKIYFRGKELPIPHMSFILEQVLLSSTQWSLQGLTLFVILNSFIREISFFEVLVTLIFSSLIAVLAHIPGGLGVLEVILLYKFKHIPRSEILVSIILYRLFAFIIPLGSALLSYSLMTLKKNKN